MALNFNLLDANLPGQIAGSFQQGYQGAQDRANLLAQRQQQNQLNALQLQGVQQEQQQRNALNRGYSEAYNPQTGGIDYNKLRQSLAAGGMGSQIPGVEKQQLEQQQTEAGLFSSKMDLFKNAWSNVRTLDDALAIHEKTHSDPIVGRMLESMGITKEQGTQRLIEAAKNPETWTNYIRQAINGADAFKQQVVGGSIYDFATGQFRTPPREQQQQPSGVQEFLFAKSPEGGGYRGSYQQFIADKAAAGRAPTTGGAVGGRAPSGYRFTPTGELEPIPGGPAASKTDMSASPLTPREIQKREAVYPQATSAIKGYVAKSNNFIKDLQALKNHPGLWEITGFVAGRAPGIGPNGRAAQALYDKIVAKGGFQALQDMRDASKTGGALGSVSNQENKQLIASFAAIDRRQNREDVQAAIDQVIDDILGSQVRMQEAYNTTYDYRNTGGSAPAKPATNIDALLEKYK
jgi:hypothetical protein